ncbi:hypothetical protein GCM10010869_55320 [Mesorhizobium tianshanense]|uniref:Uncharacterized protein DUF736 n=1 Tax=Mesorhizobium tianshanense TaxID=39844 RepID=A0A562NCF0_9HYPH|nr:uncharacterized protein DUF736 [Mesorhizobium tianshanense]GLS39935.1 hypothetical protein GCM10010869_55320 [Mesorhizobium tianshanense]
MAPLPARSAPSTSTSRRPSGPSPKDNELGPDYRIAANGVELGAGWGKAAKETGADYVSLKLDDPSFTAPVYATLVQSDNGEHKLIWSR